MNIYTTHQIYKIAVRRKCFWKHFFLENSPVWTLTSSLSLSKCSMTSPRHVATLMLGEHTRCLHWNVWEGHFFDLPFLTSHIILFVEFLFNTIFIHEFLPVIAWSFNDIVTTLLMVKTQLLLGLFLSRRLPKKVNHWRTSRQPQWSRTYAFWLSHEEFLHMPLWHVQV